MVTRSLRVPGVLLGAALFAAMLPSMVRASGHGTGTVARSRPALRLIEAVQRLSHSRLAPGIHVVATHHGRSGSHLHVLFRGNDVAPSNAISLAANVPQSLIAPNSDGITGTLTGEHHATVIDLSQLDNQSFSNTSQFALYHPHPHSYQESNVLAAMAQNFAVQVQIPAYTAFMHVNYLATVYASQADAVASGDWALTTIHQLGLSYEQPCSRAQAQLSTVSWQLPLGQALANSNPSCTVLLFRGSPDVNGEVNDEIYTVAYYGNVLEEVDYNIRDSDLQNASLSDIQQRQLLAGYGAVLGTLSSYIEAAVENAVNNGGSVNPPPTATPTNPPNVGPPPPPATNTPTPTATPKPTNTPIPQPTVKLDGLGLFVEGKDKKLHPASSLKSAQAGAFVAQVEAANYGLTAPSVTITYVLKGKTLATHQMKLVPATSAYHVAAFRPAQAAQTLQYLDVFGVKKVKKAINMGATVDVTAGSAHDSGTFRVPIKTNCSTKKGKKTCK